MKKFLIIAFVLAMEVKRFLILLFVMVALIGLFQFSDGIRSFAANAADEVLNAGLSTAANLQTATKIFPSQNEDANSGANQNTTFHQNYDRADKPAAIGRDNTGAAQGTITFADRDSVPAVGYIDEETYWELINELTNVGSVSGSSGNRPKKVNISGEIRYHYANNGGSERWNDNSGIRTYLNVNAEIAKGWGLYGLLEGRGNILNYSDKFELERIYVLGKLGSSLLQAGYFGYLMAEGNIYDSRFKGFRSVFGGPVKYTLSYGDTNYTKKTYVGTARYEGLDYDLEAGAYHYQLEDGSQDTNTIKTLGGNYHFSKFSLGGMYLGSKLKDSKGDGDGYVFNLVYGDLKSWRPGTYEAFTKYYNQSRHTYIAHGMNGIGSRLEGFKGYGTGFNYTIAPNIVAGVEYYDLKDRITEERGNTLWSQVTYYF